MNNNTINNVSLLLQALSLEILFRDFNNTDIMEELQRQDIQYFEKILQNQNEILTLLRKEDNNAREVRKEN